MPSAAVRKNPSLESSSQTLLQLGEDLFLPWLEEQNKTQRENPTPNFLSPKEGKITVTFLKELWKGTVSWIPCQA